MVESRNFTELSRACKKIVSESEIRSGDTGHMRLYVMADSASQHLVMAIKGYSVLNGLDMDVEEADYDQIGLQILNLESYLYKTRPDYLVIYMCMQKAWDSFYKTKEDDRRRFAENRFSIIKNYFEKIRNNLPDCKVIFPLLVEYNDMIYGNLGMKYDSSFIYQVKWFNFLVMQYALDKSNIYLVNMDEIVKRDTEYGPDEGRYCNYKLAFSIEGITELARNIICLVNASHGVAVKCVILDLDNTLWGGVIGDDGIENIEIGDLGIGYIYSRFQRWLKALKERGIILCVCSKNNYDIAIKPFREHPDMLLKEDDIAMFVANWEDKDTNIRHIQHTLNIGMDSMVFIDDNPFERGLVKNSIPQITVPDMPEDPADYVKYLESLNLFETSGISENDKKRTNQYRQEAKRTELMQSSGDGEAFLKSLSMKGCGALFEPFYYSRIAQLTQRSNQFNLRTVRYTENQISDIANNASFCGYYFTLKDKFGDYGLISVVILKIHEDEAFIDTWLMSCRVLKRGMEQFVLNFIVEEIRKKGIKNLVGEYIETAKNKMVSHLYADMDFRPIPERPGIYVLEVADYIPKHHFIIKEEKRNEQK